MSILLSQIDLTWKLWYRDEVFLLCPEGEPGRGDLCSKSSSAFPNLLLKGRRGCLQAESQRCVQCCDVAAMLMSNSCGWWKALLIKNPTFTTCFFGELGCHWGNHSNGIGKISCYSCFHIYVVLFLAIILVLLGPLLYFPIRAKHSRALGFFAIIATDRANRSEESKPLLQRLYITQYPWSTRHNNCNMKNELLILCPLLGNEKFPPNP